ncbi:hypothetical protein [Xanthovirga aplysinae]|uniref:hypothetical protein n=1 Tax=Xanthovirga aplysinae TaxID=2529853 RepID=UPI001CA3E96D|nr:hypothetical protein [Xanthovirga aplysinae]
MVLTSCKSQKSLLPDYSKTIAEPVKLIRQQIEKYKEPFDIEITNSHNGRYIVNSNIGLENDEVQIDTHINNQAFGSESDTTFIFTKTDFVAKLNFELEKANDQIKVAGNYQTIKVILGDSTFNFYTRQGFGLMSLLEKGKSNYTITR